MTKFSKKFSPLFWSTYSQCIFITYSWGGGVIFSDKTYIGKNALFLMQTWSRDLCKGLLVFKTLWHFSEEFQTQKTITDIFVSEF